MGIDLIVMILTLVMIGAVLFAKIITTYLLNRAQSQIQGVSTEKQKIFRDLKFVQAQKGLSDRNRLALEKKKGRLEKNIQQLQQQLEIIRDDQRRRQELQDERLGRIKLDEEEEEGE